MGDDDVGGRLQRSLGDAFRNISQETSNTDKTAKQLRHDFDLLEGTLRKVGRDHDVDFLKNFTRDTSEAGGAVERVGAVIGRMIEHIDDGNFKLARLGANLHGVGIALGIAFIQPLISGLVGLAGAFTAVASSAIQAGVAIGGTFVAGAAQAVPLVGLLVAALTRVAAVTKAVNAAQKEQLKGANQGINTANAQRNAAETVINAQHGVRDATERVTEAQRNLTETRQDARREVEDLINAERRAQLQSEAADLALFESRENLRGELSGRTASGALGSSLLDVRDSRSQRDAANLGLSRSRADADRARSLGVGGTDSVRNAQKSLEQAKRSLEDAQRGLRNAQADAAHAAEVTTASARTASELFGQLSASERRLFRALRAFQTLFNAGVFRDITDIIINSFANALEQLTVLLQKSGVIKAFRALAQGFADTVDLVTEKLSSDKATRTFLTFTAEMTKNLKPLTEILLNTSEAFVNIAVAASPALSLLLGFLVDVTEGFADLTSNQSSLTKFFSEGIVHFAAWMDLIGATLELVFALIGEGGASAGLTLVQSLTKTIQGATDSIHENGKEVAKFFEDSIRVVNALGLVVVDLGAVMLELFDPSSFEDFGKFLRLVVIPALKATVQVLDTFMGLLFQFLTLPVITRFAEVALTLGLLTGAFIILRTVFGLFAKGLLAFVKLNPLLRWATLLVTALALLGVGFDDILKFFIEGGPIAQAAKAAGLALLISNFKTLRNVVNGVVSGLKDLAQAKFPKAFDFLFGGGGKGAGKSGEIQGVRGPIAPGSAANPIHVVGEGVGGGTPGVPDGDGKDGGKGGKKGPAGTALDILKGAAGGGAGGAAASGRLGVGLAVLRSASVPTLAITVGLLATSMKLSAEDRKFIQDRTGPPKEPPKPRGPGDDPIPGDPFGGLKEPQRDQATRNAGEGTAVKDEASTAAAIGRGRKLQEMLAQTRKSFRDLKESEASVKEINDVVGINFADIEAKLGTHTTAGKKAVIANIKGAVAAIADGMHDGRINTKTGTEAIRDLLKTKTKEGRDALAENFDSIIRKVKTTMRRFGDITKDGMDLVKQLFIDELQLYGLSPEQALASANVRTGEVPGGRGRQNLEPDQLKAGGGFIGEMGERGRDMVHTLLGRGEAVLNGAQQGIVNQALALAGIPGLPGVFDMTQGSMHFMSRGGRAGMARGMAKGGIVGIPWAPGEEINSSILPLVTRLHRKYGVGVSDAFDRDHSANHQSPGHNVTGTAVDFTGTPEQLLALVRWTVAHGLTTYYNGGGGATPLAGHDTHAHVEFGGGNIALPILAKLKPIKIKGKDSPLRDLAQAVVNKVRRRAQRRLNNTITNQSIGPEGTVTPGNVNGNGSSLMRSIAASRGWNFADWWEVDRRETGHGTNLFNEGSGAALRGQFMPGLTQGHYGPGSSPWLNPTMPQQIWAMARYIKERYGNPTAARQHHDAFNWYGKGGFVKPRRMARGGFVGGAARRIGKTLASGGFAGGVRRPLRMAPGGFASAVPDDEYDELLFIPVGGPTPSQKRSKMRSLPNLLQRRLARSIKTPTFDQLSGVGGDIQHDTNQLIEDLDEQVSRVFDYVVLSEKAIRTLKNRLKKATGKQKTRIEDRLKNSDEALSKLDTVLEGITGPNGLLAQIAEGFTRLTTRTERRVVKGRFRRISGVLTRTRETGGAEELARQQEGLVDQRQFLVNERGNLQTTRDLLRERIKGTSGVERTRIKQRINAITDSLKDVNSAIVDNLNAQGELVEQQQALLVETINENATARGGVIDRFGRVLNALGQSDAVNALFTNRIQSAQQQVRELTDAQAAAAATGNTDLVKTIGESIAELNVSIAEMTASQFQGAINLVNNQASRDLARVSTRTRLAQVLAQISGTDSTSAVLALNQEETSVLQTQRTGLQGLLDIATQNHNVDDMRNLTQQLLENELAIAENTLEMKELNGELGRPQSFSSTAWQLFRTAIFNGNGQLLPNFRVPGLTDFAGGTSGAQLAGGGVSSLPLGGDVILNKAGNQHSNTHLHITSPVEVADPTTFASRFSWEMKHR